MKSYIEFLVKEKPVLFLGFSYDCEDWDGNVHNLEKTLKQHLTTAEFSILDNIHLLNGNVLNNRTKLDDYALVFIGAVGDTYENYDLVKNYCELKNIPFLSYGSPNYLYNKYRQVQLLNNNGLKTPKTYTCIGKACDINFVEKTFGYPFILKPANGSKGDGVEIIKNKNDFNNSLKKVKEEVLLLQEFIPNDCDYRIFFIDDQHIFSIKRSRTDKKEFRNNVSLGGNAERVDLEIEQLSLAKKAHKCLGFYCSGVDLIQNKETGEWYILEVNSAPQFSILGDAQSYDNVVQIFVNHINKLKK